MVNHLWPQGKAIMQAAEQADPTFLLDGVRPHTAESTKQLLHSHGTATVVARSPHSPDLNPKENLWAWMKNRVYACQYDSLEGLKVAVLEAWECRSACSASSWAVSTSARGFALHGVVDTLVIEHTSVPHAGGSNAVAAGGGGGGGCRGEVMTQSCNIQRVFCCLRAQPLLHIQLKDMHSLTCASII